MRKKFIILIILILAIITVLGAIFLFINGNDDEQYSDLSILVLLVDPNDENSPGLGAVDFAFVVKLENHSISNMTTIYPTGPGMEHPTEPPNMPMTNLQIKKLYLHNSLFDVPLNEGAKHAQEIVEYNKGIKTDAVVIINPDVVDAVLESIGGVDVNGSHITNNSLDFLREEQYSNKISRPDIVKSVGFAIKDASKNSSKRSAMISAITVQYLEGNIITIPNDLFYKLISNEGIRSIF